MSKTKLIHPSLVDEYRDEFLKIFRNQLGRGFLTEREFKRALNPGGNLFAVVAFPDYDADTNPPIQQYYTALPDRANAGSEAVKELPDNVHNKPVGVCVSAKFNKNQFASHVKFHPGDYPRALIRANQICVHHAVSVREEVQQRGIGTELFRTGMKVGNVLGCDAQVVMAWRSPHGIHIHEIMQRLGFNLKGEFKEYWFKDSLRREFECPICGPPPCTCNGVLYVK